MSAVFTAAPKPVSTPQPMSAAAVIGMSSEIFTAPIAGTTVSSEKVPDAPIWNTGWPPREKRLVMSRRPPAIAAADPASQSSGWSCRQK